MLVIMPLPLSNLSTTGNPLGRFSPNRLWISSPRGTGGKSHTPRPFLGGSTYSGSFASGSGPAFLTGGFGSFRISFGGVIVLDGLDGGLGDGWLGPVSGNALCIGVCPLMALI